MDESSSPNPRDYARHRIVHNLGGFMAEVFPSKTALGLYFEPPLSTEGGIAARLTIASQKYVVLIPFMKRNLSDDVIMIGFTDDITWVIVW